jgi:hypothetical protein
MAPTTSDFSGIQSLPLELFSVIASHVPLPNRPATLLSLALTSRCTRNLIIPSLLYEHLIIHNEQSLILVVENLWRNAHLRLAVRGIYIRASLTRAESGTSFPALTKLRDLFDLGGLSGVKTIDLRLGSYLGSHENGRPDAFGISNPFESLPDDFWPRLNGCCPRIQTLTIDHHGPRYPITRSVDLFPWNRHTQLAHFKVRMTFCPLRKQLMFLPLRTLLACRWCSHRLAGMLLVECWSTSRGYLLSLSCFTFGESRGLRGTGTSNHALRKAFLTSPFRNYIPLRSRIEVGICLVRVQWVFGSVTPSFAMSKYNVVGLTLPSQILMKTLAATKRIFYRTYGI